jgi:Tol biopolymer transport system component
MSRFDDRLTRELDRVARPAETTDVFDEIDRRRGRRAVVRRVQTAMLATVVFAGSIGGVLVLNRAFRGDGGTTAAVPPAHNGLIVVSFGDDGGVHLYLQNPSDPSWDPRDHQLTNDASKDTAPAVSPNGQMVAFERFYLTLGPINARPAVWVVGIDGARPHLLVSDATDPAWSPDGTRIAFVRPGGGGDAAGLYTVRADGTNVRLLLAADGLTMSSPSWSPDGLTLAFQANLPDQIYEVGTIEVDGKGLITGLPNTTSDTPTQPSWSPDASKIAFVRGHDVWTMDPSGGQQVGITTVDDPSSTDELVVDSQPTWSPDGQWIAFERFFSPSEFFVYAVRPDGTDLHRVGLGGDPAWAAMVPEPSATDTPEPTETASPAEQGRDIGLGFNLCQLESLNGIDFLGDGANGAAWVGARLAGDGSCPPLYEGESIVAVDVDGDGSAESWAPLARCLACSPFDVTDLNADGVQELVVTLQVSSVTEYTLFSLQPVPGNGPPELQQVTVAEPGSKPNFPAGRPVSLWAGGDEGYSARIECENYPDAPVLIVTTGDHPVDGPGSETRDVVRTRLVLGTNGTISVQGTDHFTEPTNADPSAVSFTGRACGVAFYGMPT